MYIIVLFFLLLILALILLISYFVPFLFIEVFIFFNLGFQMQFLIWLVFSFRSHF
jgi:hypothetical protein